MPKDEKSNWIRWSTLVLALLGIFWSTASWKSAADERVIFLEDAMDRAQVERTILEKGTRAEIKLLTAEIAELRADLKVLSSRFADYVEHSEGGG